MSLSVAELMGLVRRPRRAHVTKVIEGEKRTTKPRTYTRTTEQRARWEKTYIERHREKYLAMRRRQQKRRYWADPEFRAKKLASQRHKADYTPEEWARRLDQLRAAAARRRAKAKAAT
jgi:hypothetical protein